MLWAFSSIFRRPSTVLTVPSSLAPSLKFFGLISANEAAPLVSPASAPFAFFAFSRWPSKSMMHFHYKIPLICLSRLSLRSSFALRAFGTQCWKSTSISLHNLGQLQPSYYISFFLEKSSILTYFGMYVLFVKTFFNCNRQRSFPSMWSTIVGGKLCRAMKWITLFSSRRKNLGTHSVLA